MSRRAIEIKDMLERGINNMEQYKPGVDILVYIINLEYFEYSSTLEYLYFMTRAWLVEPFK